MPIELPTTFVPLLFFVGYLASVAVSLGFLVYIARYRWEQPDARAFAWVSVCVGIWSIGYVARLLSTELSAKLLWTQFSWIGITLTPVAVLLFALGFTGRRHVRSRKAIAGLLVIPVITQVLLWTNDQHGWFYEDVWLYTADSIPIIASRGGEWFYAVHLPYSWGLYLIATVLFIQFAVRATDIYRLQVLGLLFGALFPWVVNGTFLAGFRVHPELDPTPIGIAIGMGGLAVAVFYVNFLGLIPVAREQVLDKVEECIFVIDDNDRIIDVNGAGAAFLDAWCGDAWSIGDFASERFPAEVPLDAPPGVETELDFTLDGTHVWVLYRHHSLDEATYAGRIVTLTDITDLKRQQRLLAQQNEQLENVASVMSHDLRSPLGVASGALRRVSQSLDEPITDTDRSDLLRKTELIEESHHRMDNIIEDVLALARSGHQITDIERIDLEVLAKRAWSFVDTDGIDLEIVDSEEIQGDVHRLLRVFENLYQNAVIHGEDATTIRVGTLPDGFYVEDDGIGISPEQREAIFETGMTTTSEGTGLGLPITRNIVDAHGWNVNVTDASSGGSRFEITGVEDG